jgi:hypothetical protein
MSKSMVNYRLPCRRHRGLHYWPNAICGWWRRPRRSLALLAAAQFLVTTVILGSTTMLWSTSRSFHNTSSHIPVAPFL